MFICEQCGKCSKPREKLNIQPVVYRQKLYLSRAHTRDTGGRGEEIVKVMKLCTTCVMIPKSIEIQPLTPAELQFVAYQEPSEDYQS